MLKGLLLSISEAIRYNVIPMNPDFDPHRLDLPKYRGFTLRQYPCTGEEEASDEDEEESE